MENEFLPAVSRTKNQLLILPTETLEEFLEADLSVKRVEDISRYLWLVGRPLPPRPLNLQRVLKRDIISTTDISLHLVWTTKKIYIKALPSYLTSGVFWSHLLPERCEQPVDLPECYRNALGLLHSYLALVPTELDFALAHESHLFHDGYTWQEWLSLSRLILKKYPGQAIYEHVPKRYVYGELRLSRLDKIYRCSRLEGFSKLTNYTRYVDFFVENLTVVAATTVYIGIVLTSMQVGLSVSPLQENIAFQKASYIFTVFAIVSPVIAVGSLVGVVVFMFFVNWSRAIIAKHERMAALAAAQTSEPYRSKRTGRDVVV